MAVAPRPFAARARTRATRRVLVLADMLELGDAAEAAHAEIGRAAAALCRLNSDDRLIAVGRLAAHIAGAARGRWPADQVLHMPILDAARVAATIEPGDSILLKGSRGMRLEGVVAALRERASPVQEPKSAPDHAASTPDH